MTDVKVELLPCPNPWCGDHIYCTYNRPPLWRVHCGCGVKGPTAYTETEAIAAWNHRATLSPLGADGLVEAAELAGEFRLAMLAGTGTGHRRIPEDLCHRILSALRSQVEATGAPIPAAEGE